MSFLAKTRNPGVTLDTSVSFLAKTRNPGVTLDTSVSFLAKIRNPGVTLDTSVSFLAKIRNPGVTLNRQPGGFLVFARNDNSMRRIPVDSRSLPGMRTR